MADESVIENALLAKVLLLETTGPSLPVAFPDIDFSAPEDGKYLSATIFYNRPKWEGLGEPTASQGLLQINVHWPRGEGRIPAQAVADQVKQAFNKGLMLTQNSVRITINRAPWSGSPISEDSQLLVPVTISWLAS